MRCRAGPKDGNAGAIRRASPTRSTACSAIAVLEPARRLLWVAASVAGALRDGALPPTRALRQAFASVEREARQMLGRRRLQRAARRTRRASRPASCCTTSPTATAATGRSASCATPSTSPRTCRANPNSRTPAAASAAATARCSTPWPAAIKEDLLRVKDALDLHLRTGQTDVADLQPQVEALDRVADTLGMLGLGVPRNVVQQQRDAMHEIVTGDRPADEGALLDIAGALLYVDASLDDQVARLGPRRRRSADDDLLRRRSRARCSTCW